MNAPSPLFATRVLHPNFALEVDERVDRLLDMPEAMRELRRLWSQWPVMIFRRQSLAEEEQVRFSTYFGSCESASRRDIQSPYHEEIIYFSTLKYHDGRFVGGFAGGEDLTWHSDQTFRERPATGAVLYGVEVPQDGGRMDWADQYGAWKRLPADVQALIDGRTGIYRYAKRYEQLNPLELAGSEQVKMMLKLPDARHPVVLTHPVTGRKALYADPTTLVAIEGLSAEENARVLPILFEAGGSPELVYSHKVRHGDLMMWDNGCTMHRREEIRVEQPRLMKRTTFRLPVDGYCVPHA
jgi:alpha-ketoglutarate-dependent taurine dioxygenase